MAVLNHRRPHAVIGALVFVVGLFTFSPSAQASTTTAERSSAVVTRLPLIHDAGRIPVQVKIVGDNTVGFSIDIPAAGGTWQTARDIVIPGLSVHCLGVPGANLRYACGHANYYASTAPAIPAGQYLLSLPALRTGAWAGVTGSTSVYQGDPAAQIASDTFPVVDGSTGPRSNAEVRMLTTTPYSAGGGEGAGDLAVTVTVVGGDSPTTALDVRMPSGLTWSITRVAGGGHLTCGVRSAVEQSDVLHCVSMTGGTVSPFPTGVFTVVLGVSAMVNNETVYWPPQVALAYANGTSQIPDTFYWHVS